MHMLVWVKDAPVLGEQTDEMICKFVDKYVTCDNEAASK